MMSIVSEITLGNVIIFVGYLSTFLLSIAKLKSSMSKLFNPLTEMTNSIGQLKEQNKLIIKSLIIYSHGLDKKITDIHYEVFLELVREYKKLGNGYAMLELLEKEMEERYHGENV